MGIGARWKHFKIYVELTANFALLIFPSLEGLVKVLGGIWIVGGKGDAITAQSRVFCMEQAVGFVFFFFFAKPHPKVECSLAQVGSQHIPELLRVFLGSLQSQLLSCI